MLTENPDIKTFAIHPGAILTQMGQESKAPMAMVDTVALPAATMLHLTAGKADFLSGRWVDI